MPDICAVPGCRTGYPKEPKKPGVSLHSFPKDPGIITAWMKAIPRQN